MEDGQHRPLRFLQYWALERKSRPAGDPDTEASAADAAQRLPGFADYVISFKFTPPENDSVLKKARELSERPRAVEDKRHAKADKVAEALSDLVKRLSRAGLDVEIRQALAAKKTHHHHQGSSSAGDGESPQRAMAFSPESGHFLLFVRCPRERLLHEWSRSRLHDWLCGMLPLRRVPRDAALQRADPLEVDPETHDDPSRLLKAEADTAEQMSPSERQRLVYKLIVGPVEEGCAGVNTENERWVQCIFPLQDRSFNKDWIKHWSSKWLIDRHDLRRIREHFGEEIAMYFAFLQSYFLWLAIPSAIGVLSWLFGWNFSWQFGIVIVLWSLLFTETWARRESDIATYWGVHGAEKAASFRRPHFRPDRTITDPSTGEPIPFFSNGKRWLRRLLGIPVVIVLALLMAIFVSFIFAVQTFLDEYYDGPFHSLLGFTPAVLFSACLPVYTAICTHVAKVLTEYENYEFESEYAAQYTTKIFIFRFLQDQLYLFLTAWVFVPHQDTFEYWLRGIYDMMKELPPWLMPYLAREIEKDGVVYTGIKASSTPATTKIQDLLTYFIVTGQVVNLMTETGIPLMMRWWNSRALKKASAVPAKSEARKDEKGEKGEKGDEKDGAKKSASPLDLQRKLASSSKLLEGALSTSTSGVEAWVDSLSSADTAIAPADVQNEFIANITQETQLPEYDPYEDYAEMASQFSCVTFFSVAWPLAPLAAFLNNWLELRTDAAKICATTKRPIPRRVDTIGPWLGTLRFMCWLSSITNALLIYQFHPNCSFLPTIADPEEMKRFGRTNLSLALVVLLFSEHIFLAIRWIIMQVMASWPSAYERIVARARAQSKRRWLEKAPAVLRDLADADDSASVDADEGASQGAENAADSDLSAIPEWRAELDFGLDAVASAFKTE